MKLFFSYLKLNLKSILTFLTVCCIFLAVGALYSVEGEPVVYAAVLCAVSMTVFLAVGFFRFRSKHRALIELQKSIELSLSALPEPANIIEEDYSALIHTLYTKKALLQSETDALITDMTDYYTLWAHQIKTPISAARLLLQSKENEDPELDEQLFRIEQYVEMVLTYLRSDSDTTDYVIRLEDLDDIVGGALKKYARSFIRKKTAFEFTPTQGFVVTDKKWLSFVIEQLLSNALKYTNSGKISIYSKDKGTLIIEDTGIGIAPEDLPRVFEKGYTGYNGRVQQKSTGIGLYLCKKILDRLSHSIEIESEVGKGTRVKLTFNENPTVYE